MNYSRGKNNFFKDFIYLFLERGEGRKERNINVWLLLVHPPLGTWPATQACGFNSPDWELNWQNFGLQASTQTTEPYQPGPKKKFF